MPTLILGFLLDLHQEMRRLTQQNSDTLKLTYFETLKLEILENL